MENGRYYELEMVNGSGKIDKKFETYKEAYDYMCKMYFRELSEGYTPTLYMIIMTVVSTWNGKTNKMIQPVWS